MVLKLWKVVNLFLCNEKDAFRPKDNKASCAVATEPEALRIVQRYLNLYTISIGFPEKVNVICLVICPERLKKP